MKNLNHIIYYYYLYCGSTYMPLSGMMGPIALGALHTYNAKMAPVPKGMQASKLYGENQQEPIDRWRTR